MSPAGSPSRGPDRIQGLALRKGESFNAIRGGDVLGAQTWRAPLPSHFTALLVGKPPCQPAARGRRTRAELLAGSVPESLDSRPLRHRQICRFPIHGRTVTTNSKRKRKVLQSSIAGGLVPSPASIRAKTNTATSPRATICHHSLHGLLIHATSETTTPYKSIFTPIWARSHRQYLVLDVQVGSASDQLPHLPSREC